jgi:hypothetical protein
MTEVCRNAARVRTRFILSAFGILVAWAGASVAQAAAPMSPEACGNPFVNHFGPWDYREAPRDHLNNVESNHFTPGVESLTRAKTTDQDKMGGDIAYTLHVFPNHHRALITMMRLAERQKVDPLPGTVRPVECYFYRAVLFRPNDTVARMIYAQYLAKRSRKPEALDQLRVVNEVAVDNPLSQFSLGLIYFDMGEFDLSLAAAHRARALGWERTELEDKLKAANKWSPPN